MLRCIIIIYTKYLNGSASALYIIVEQANICDDGCLGWISVKIFAFNTTQYQVISLIFNNI